MLNYLLITTAIVLVWDYFDFPHQLAAQVMSHLMKHPVSPLTIDLPKPFGCSTCMSFWVTLVYMFCTNIHLWFVPLLCAFSVKYIGYVLSTIDLIISNIFELVQKPFIKK